MDLRIAPILLIAMLSIGTTYYVDATSGDDSNNGTSTGTPWKTIAKVNVSTQSPGDSVLFKRGETWRGERILPDSGSSEGYVTYGAYGIGPAPLILGSYEWNDTGDWTDEGSNIWSADVSGSVTGAEILTNGSFDSDTTGWSFWNSADATASGSRTTTAGEYDSAPAGYKIAVTANGDGGSDIQFYQSNFSITAGKWYKFTFAAKCSAEFTLDATIRFMKAGSPYSNYYSMATTKDLNITTSFQTFTIYYYSNITADDARITFYLGNEVADGETFFVDTISLKEFDGNVLAVDVGNLIFDGATSTGTKVENEVDLDTQDEFFYDSTNFVLKMYSTSNPASAHSDIECALKLSALFVGGGADYNIVENLDFRYGAGHGVDVGDNMIVRDNLFSYIGGGAQTSSVRYGNAIELWESGSDIEIYRNRIDNIYDAALTNQGNDSGTIQQRIYYYNNVITNSEYCCEMWLNNAGATMSDVYFENNTCAYSGCGWGHNQRWDGPNGTDVVISATTATTSNLHIRNNIFYEAADRSVRAATGYVDKYSLDYNLYYKSSGNVAIIGTTTYDYATEFSAYQSATGYESNGVTGDPLLTDIDGDFKVNTCTVKSSSPAVDAGETISNVTDDFRGVPRPQGSGYDIGACEYGSIVKGVFYDSVIQ